jgi:hypothetical protein
MPNEGNNIPTGTAAGLLEFLDWLVEKGYGTSAALGPWKSASSRVFEMVEPTEDVGSIDVRSIDVADYLERFGNKAIGTKLKQESVVSYGQRFEKAVAAYLEYLDHKKLPAIRRVGTRMRPKAEPTPIKKNGNGNGHTVGPEAEVSSLIDYPFPLRSGQVAYLKLPMRLDKADAERLGTFVRTLAFEPVLELTATTGEESA